MAGRKKKYYSHKRNKYPGWKKILLLLGFFFLLLTAVFIAYFTPKSQEIRSNAAGSGCKCDNPNACHPDGCSRDVAKINGDCGGYADLGPEPGAVDQTLCVKPPDCCAGGGGNCCWIERGFCTLAQCGNSTKNGCGWYWTWHDGETSKPNGYGCMIGDSPETMRPKFGSPVVPTNVSSVSPTSLPVIPTNTSAPVIPTEVPPTRYIPPTSSYVAPTSPPYNPPVVNQPIHSNPQPTTYNSQSTSIPTPPPKPIIDEYVKNFQNLVQNTKTSILDFLSKVLP